MKRLLKLFYLSAFTLLAGAAAMSCSSDDDSGSSGDNTPPYLAIDGDNLVTFEEGGGDAKVGIKSEKEWSALIDSDWCSMTYDYSSVYITAPVNYDTELKKAKIAVTSGSGVNTSIVVITVVQSGAGEAWVKFSPEEDMHFEVGGGEQSVDILTNQSVWKVTKGDEESNNWFTIVRDEESDKVTIKAEENSAYEERSAVITVTAGVKSNIAVATLTIVQDAAQEPQTEYTDLSNTGTSNCYIVSAPGDYSFAANVIGNGENGIVSDEFHTLTSEISPVSARLVWQDGKGIITSVSLSEDGDKVLFEVADPFAGGNAIIAVCNAEDTIIWSWHIWMPRTAVAELPISSGYNIMNMNLGAVNDSRGDQGSFGTLYQWGRKDPLPGTPTLTGTSETLPVTVYDIDGNEVSISNSSWYSTEQNTLTYSIENPTICLSNYSQYSASQDWLTVGTGIDALWGNPYGNEKNEDSAYVNKGTKSIYDPCPVGWRVPPADVFKNFTASGGYAWVIDDFSVVDVNSDSELTIDDYNYGWDIWLDNDHTVSSFFPAAARYDGSYAMLMGSVSGLWGAYWGNTPHADSDYLKGAGFGVLSFGIEDLYGNSQITMSPMSSAGRANAFSVRCIKEDTINR